MAKKKNPQNKQQMLSPEQFIRQRARTLPIGKCYVTSEDLHDEGEGIFVVTRVHTNGKISIAFYLVDIYCLGVKDSFYYLWRDAEEAEQIIHKHYTLDECSYEMLHNYIYGAVAYAEEAGIAPDYSFNLTQYMLEEDTDEIPLIEYEFGKDGQHFLVCYSVQEANRYLPKVKAQLGDDFKFIIRDDDEDDFTDSSDWDEETMLERLQNIKDHPMFKSYGPATEYTYKHPEYPDSLNLTSPEWFYRELHDPENKIYLKKDLVSRILQLPRELVRENLEKIILYHIGKTCDGIPDDYEPDGFTGIISNSVILLGEVGNSTSSLNVVLELLRQNMDFSRYHFADATQQVMTSTLYLLGQNQLERLMDYMKEEGLDTFCKAEIFPAVTQLAICQPERRDEVLHWYQRVIRFAIKMLPKTQWFDNSLAGLMLCDLVDMQAKELLPDIKKMFATNLVDLSICGNYAEVSKSIIDPRHVKSAKDYIVDVYERFADMKRVWDR